MSVTVMRGSPDGWKLDQESLGILFPARPAEDMNHDVNTDDYLTNTRYNSVLNPTVPWKIR
jgi:hypothetical protein